MATLKEIVQRFRELRGREMEFAAKALEKDKEKILSLNRLQLFEGKDSDGNDLSPTYQEDPYFKTRESAQRYSDWKDKITPNPKRKPGVPNLYINGYFHNSIDASVRVDGIQFDSSFDKASSIENKFGSHIYGLNDESKTELMHTVKPNFNKDIREFLKL